MWVLAEYIRALLNVAYLNTYDPLQTGAARCSRVASLSFVLMGVRVRMLMLVLICHIAKRRHAEESILVRNSLLLFARSSQARRPGSIALRTIFVLEDESRDLLTSRDV